MPWEPDTIQAVSLFCDDRDRSGATRERKPDLAVGKGRGTTFADRSPAPGDGIIETERCSFLEDRKIELCRSGRSSSRETVAYSKHIPS
jgi:hypothetical protein